MMDACKTGLVVDAAFVRLCPRVEHTGGELGSRSGAGALWTTWIFSSCSSPGMRRGDTPAD